MASSETEKSILVSILFGLAIGNSVKILRKICWENSELLMCRKICYKRNDRNQISDHQQSWGYEEAPSKGPWSHALLVIADLEPYLGESF